MNMIHVRCTRCNQLIDVSDPHTYLLRAGKLVRIRCREEICLEADWYSEMEFESAGQPEASLQPELVNPGVAQTQWFDLLTSGI